METVSSAAVASSSLKDDIQSALKEVGISKVDPAILSQCVALATTLQVGATQLAECWEAVSLTRNLAALNAHSMQALRASLVREAETVPDASSSSAIQIKRTNATASPEASSSRPHFVTPAAKASGAAASFVAASATMKRGATSMALGGGGRRISMSPKPPNHWQPNAASGRKKAKYDERAASGSTVATYEAPNLLPTSSSNSTRQTRPKCSIATAAFGDTLPLAAPYRHMFTTLDQQAAALEGQLTEFSQTLVKSLEPQEMAAVEAVGIPRQEPVTCLGRICSSAHEGRMNATTVLLEGSRATSGGARVEVDLSHLTTDYSLFPGQIVAVEGHNTSGRKLVAQRLCEGVAPPPLESTAGDLFRFHHEQQDGSPLRIVTAAGPFTTADNLDYQPLLDFLSLLQADAPDVVILTGPFVDLNHGAVQAGQMTVAFENDEQVTVPAEVFFCHKIAGVLEDFYAADNVHTQFILQPSVEDATAEWVYPQAPFKDRLPKPKGTSLPGGDAMDLGTLGLAYVESVNRTEQPYRRVHCVPNPCTLRINELVVGLTSTDVLLQVSTNETNARLPAGSRLTRIAQHLVQQQSYYPLFPAQVNLDWQQRQHWRMPCRPDLLILPSKLSPMAKTIDSTVVINPGPLTRDTTGGTYAVLEVHPMDRTTLEETDAQVSLPHQAAQRTRVQVKRI